jgi:hypothetical protein
VGVASGLLGVFLLGKANRPLSADDVTVQIALTVCVAYLVFVGAQVSLSLSGVLACYSAGLMFSWLAPALFLRREAVHIVWGMVEWLANTLIFLLAGLVIGTETINYIDWRNCGYLLLLYLALMLIRFFVVFSLLPAVSWAGRERCSVREAALISWSGLRGAMSIALALMVRSASEEVHSTIDASHANKLLFYVGGIAGLTLLVNATTVTPVLSALGILEDESSQHKLLILHARTRNLRKRMRERMAELLEDVPAADPREVVRYNSLLWEEEREMDLMLQGDPSSHNERVHRQVDAFVSRDARSVVQKDVLCYVQQVFLNIVRVEYWESITAGRIPRDSMYTSALLYSIDKALAEVHQPSLQDWKCLCEEMVPSDSFMRALASLEGCFGRSRAVDALRETYTNRMDELQVYLLTNFIRAHESAQKKVCSFMGQSEVDPSVLPEEAAVIEESLKSVGMILFYCTIRLLLFGADGACRCIVRAVPWQTSTCGCRAASPPGRWPAASSRCRAIWWSRWR